MDYEKISEMALERMSFAIIVELIFSAEVH